MTICFYKTTELSGSNYVTFEIGISAVLSSENENENSFLLANLSLSTSLLN